MVRRKSNAGRKKHPPNLKKVAGGYQNQHGVTFTAEQKAALERAVKRSNYQRKKQLKAEAEMPRRNGQSGTQLQLMGFESDFIITHQPRTLQRFKTMADYEKFMDKQVRIQSGEYLADKTRLYKRNYMAALDNVFGDAAKDVKMRVRMMKPEEFRRMVQSDELAEIGYIYDPSAQAGKLNQIRASFGMRLKEEEYDE